MALRLLPPNAGRRPALDDFVVLDLAPVPGAVHGPSVALPWLDRAGVKSGPSWFAYIAGRSLIWIPGTTRRPVPNTSGKVYGWSRNPDDYPVLSLADLRRFGFGKGDAKNRTRAEILTPWQALPDLTVTESTDRRTGVCGWRLLPTDRGDGRLCTLTGESCTLTGESCTLTGEYLHANRGKTATTFVDV